VNSTGAAAAVEVQRVIDLHHCPFTRVWVCSIVTPVPLGTHTAGLSCINTGTPPAFTRVGLGCHTTGPQGGVEEQPATVYAAAVVTTAWPETRTRGSGRAGWAGALCAHSTLAPTCSK
jgi:hypothetical protein